MSTVTKPISPTALTSAIELYLGFFGRTPDAAGLYYWSNQISHGMSPIEVAAGFAKSAEFVKKYGHLSASEQVQLAYQNILARPADPGGAQYWTEKLQNGTPIGDIIWSLVHSAYSQQGTADANMIQNKVNSVQKLMAPSILDAPTATWNISSGYGVINVASALSSVIGATIQEGARFKTSVEQWPIPVTQFSDAWTSGYTGKGVVVAVIDTGLDLKNPALNHTISPWSWNFVNNTANVQDDNGHGTAVATNIISRPSEGNTNALVGGAYEAELMVLKAVDKAGKGTQANLVAAINHAVEHGADVINLSLGGGASDQAIINALQNAAQRGVIVCMAAGNSGASTPQFPAVYAQGSTTTIAVGAVMQANDGSVVWSGSTNAAGSTLPYNYVLAPGTKVLAYGLNNVVQSWSGTSFATPFVSAAVAALLSSNTGLASEQIVNAVVNTAVELVGTPINII